MPAPPRHQLGDVVAGDVGEELVLAEELDQVTDLPLSVVGTGMMLPDLLPIASGDVIEPERCRCPAGLLNPLLRFLALDSLYRFRFAPGCALGRAVKAMTSDLEVVAPERRALVAADGHVGKSLRV